MFGSTNTLRGVGFLIAIVGIVFGLMTAHSALQAVMSQTAASGTIAASAFIVALGVWGVAAIREHQKRQYAVQMVQRLLQESPLTGLMATIAAGAAARLGINPNDAVHWINALMEPDTSKPS